MQIRDETLENLSKHLFWIFCVSALQRLGTAAGSGHRVKITGQPALLHGTGCLQYVKSIFAASPRCAVISEGVGQICCAYAPAFTCEGVREGNYLFSSGLGREL